MTPAPAERSPRPIVLVTGGSRGIGLALAHGFAARGHDVVLLARNRERLQQAAAAIAATHGVFVDHVPCDLAQPGAIATLMASLDAARLRVDILVNCAGVGTAGAFSGNEAAEIQAALRLNIDAATALMHACLPGMVARGGGGVLNVASLAGTLPMPYLALYGATKSYLAALSRAVASEVAGKGVRVSVVLPGPVDTGFFARSMQADEQRTGLLPGLSPEAVARTAIDGFFARQTVITPGMLGWLCRLGAKLLPHRMLLAFLGLMLRGSHSDARTAVHAPSLARHEPGPSMAPYRPRRMQQVLGGRGHVLILACVATALVLQVGIATRKAPHVEFGTFSPIAVAAGLIEHGVYANAFVPGGAQTPAPELYLSPGYPAVIAGMAALDRGLADTVRCLAAQQVACMRGNPFRPLIVLQTLLALLALGLAYHVARHLSGSGEIAALATLLTFVMGRFGELAVTINPYAILPPLTLIFCALLCIAHRQRSLLVSGAAGLILGLLTLVGVYHAPLVVLAPLLLAAAEFTRATPRWRFALGGSATLAVTASLVLAPWVARNLGLFGDIEPTQTWETRLLAERMVYSGLSPGELVVALFFWLPGLGDLSSLLLPAEATRKFDVYYKGSLLLEVGRVLNAAPAGADSSQFLRILDMYALGRPAEYALITALLFVRGLRATGGILVLCGWLAVPLLWRRLGVQREQAAFLLIAGPLVGVAVVQSLFTANLPWMNVSLVFVYAYAIAAVTGGLELPLGLRRLFAGPGTAEGTSSVRS